MGMSVGRFLRGWGWPLSMGMLSGALIVAVAYDPPRKADFTVSVALCNSLRETGWRVEASDRACRVSVKYRRSSAPFLRIEQEGRAVRINRAEVLAIATE